MARKKFRKGLQRLSRRQTRLETEISKLRSQIYQQKYDVERLVTTVKWNVEMLKQMPTKESYAGLRVSELGEILDVMYKNSVVSNLVSLPGNPFEERKETIND